MDCSIEDSHTSWLVLTFLLFLTCNYVTIHENIQKPKQGWRVAQWISDKQKKCQDTMAVMLLLHRFALIEYSQCVSIVKALIGFYIYLPWILHSLCLKDTALKTLKDKEYTKAVRAYFLIMLSLWLTYILICVWKPCTFMCVVQNKRFQTTRTKFVNYWEIFILEENYFKWGNFVHFCVGNTVCVTVQLHFLALTRGKNFCDVSSFPWLWYWNMSTN